MLRSVTVFAQIPVEPLRSHLNQEDRFEAHKEADLDVGNAMQCQTQISLPEPRTRILTCTTTNCDRWVVAHSTHPVDALTVRTPRSLYLPSPSSQNTHLPPTRRPRRPIDYRDFPMTNVMARLSRVSAFPNIGSPRGGRVVNWTVHAVQCVRARTLRRW